MNILVDKLQFVGEVKERNKFYKALINIRTLAEVSYNSNERSIIESKNQMKKIISICDESLRDVI